MLTIHPQYITDSVGKKMVVLSSSEFETIMAELEELEDIRLYDEAKNDLEPSVPIDEAFKLLESKRAERK